MQAVVLCERKQSIYISLPLFRVEDGIFSGIYQQAGKDFKLIGSVGEDQHSRFVFREKGLILEQGQIAEHTAVFHMVAVQQRIGVCEVAGISRVQENASGQSEFAVNIPVNVGQVGAALQHGVIDFGVVHHDPGADVGVDGQEFFKGGTAVFFHGRLDFDHIRLDVAGGGIDAAVIPEGIGRVDACHA